MPASRADIVLWWHWPLVGHRCKNNKDGWIYFTLHLDPVKMSGGERHWRNAEMTIGWTFLLFHCRPIRFISQPVSNSSRPPIGRRGRHRMHVSPVNLNFCQCLRWLKGRAFYTNSLQCWSLIFCQWESAASTLISLTDTTVHLHMFYFFSVPFDFPWEVCSSCFDQNFQGRRKVTPSSNEDILKVGEDFWDVTSRSVIQLHFSTEFGEKSLCRKKFCERHKENQDVNVISFFYSFGLPPLGVTRPIICLPLSL